MIMSGHNKLCLATWNVNGMGNIGKRNKVLFNLSSDKVRYRLSAGMSFVIGRIKATM